MIARGRGKIHGLHNMNKNSGLKYIFCVLTAGCMWGCMGLLVRPLNDIGLVSMDIVALRAFVTVIVTFASLPLLSKINGSRVREDIKIKFKDTWIFLGTGIASVVFFNFCYFNTIIYTSLSVAAIMLYTAPIFVMIISAFVFHDKITSVKVIAILLAFIGCGVVTGVIGGNIAITATGALFGLGAGIGYALYSIFGKIATKRGYNSVTVTLYTFVMASVGVLPFCDFKGIVNVFSENPQMLVLSFVLILVTTFFPYIFYTAGLNGMEPGRAAVVACIEPVAATFVGWIAFNERPSVSTVLGVLMVIGAIFIINVGQDGKDKVDK